MEGPNDRLLKAVKANDAEAVRRALDEGADPNNGDFSGDYRNTPALYHACRNKNLQIARLLLERGADPNGADDEHAPWGSEVTPCLHAAFPDAAIMRALLEKGADPDAKAYSRDDVLTTYLLSERGEMTAEIEDLLACFRKSAEAASGDLRMGTAVVEGIAETRGPDGAPAIAADKSVYLIGCEKESDELWRRVCAGELQPAPDLAQWPHERRVAADAAGRFRFEKVPAGPYYIACRIELTWEEPISLGGSAAIGNMHRKVLLGARVTVREGRTQAVRLEKLFR